MPILLVGEEVTSYKTTNRRDIGVQFWHLSSIGHNSTNFGRSVPDRDAFAHFLV
jgi:hypothetical protein